MPTGGTSDSECADEIVVQAFGIVITHVTVTLIELLRCVQRDPLTWSDTGRTVEDECEARDSRCDELLRGKRCGDARRLDGLREQATLGSETPHGRVIWAHSLVRTFHRLSPEREAPTDKPRASHGERDGDVRVRKEVSGGTSNVDLGRAGEVEDVAGGEIEEAEASLRIVV